jgi:hypothetical protein
MRVGWDLGNKPVLIDLILGPVRRVKTDIDYNEQLYI